MDLLGKFIDMDNDFGFSAVSIAEYEAQIKVRISLKYMSKKIKIGNNVNK